MSCLKKIGLSLCAGSSYKARALVLIMSTCPPDEIFDEDAFMVDFGRSTISPGKNTSRHGRLSSLYVRALHKHLCSTAIHIQYGDHKTPISRCADRLEFTQTAYDDVQKAN